MEEKSIDQLRREAQELYQSKLQAYQQAQKETTQKKETVQKLFLKTGGLKKFFEPVFFKSNKKNVIQSEEQKVSQSKPYQQITKETSQILKKPGITITEKVFETAYFESGSEEKSVDELRRESQELYQSKLQAYQHTQQAAVHGIFQKPKELKKEGFSVLRKNLSSIGIEDAGTNTFINSKKSSEQNDNLFVISIFLIMVIIVLVKLLLFMP